MSPCPKKSALAICIFLAGAATGYLLRGEGGRARDRGPAGIEQRDDAGARGAEFAGEDFREGAGGHRDAGPAREAGDGRQPGREAGRGWREGVGERGGDGNPFAGRPPDELMSVLRDSIASRDNRSFKMAGEVLGDLGPAQVEEIAALLAAATDSDAAFLIANELVRHGGKEGMKAVSGVARDERLGFDARAQAIEALGNAPPERRDDAATELAALLRAGIQPKLQSCSANAYARLLGRESIAGLTDLLDAGGVRAEPLLDAIGSVAKPEDVPLLAKLLARPLGRESQGILLRAIGTASGAEGGKTMMEFLKSPPDGVRREDIGWALADMARKDDLPGYWDALSGEENRSVQTALARAIARTGGQAEIEKLARLAGDPSSGIAPEAVARAIADGAGKESLPIMLDMLKGSRVWESAEPLARGIARVSGREGLDGLLGLAETAGPEDRRRALIQVVEDYGDPSVVDRLGEMLGREKEQGVSFHLAKAILRLDPVRGQETIAASLADFEDPSQRAAIAQVLEKEGGTKYVPIMAKALGTESDEHAQWQMARTMASAGSDGISALGELLSSDPDAKRRASILRGAGSVQSEETAGLARRLIGADPAWEVRATAAKMIGMTGGASAAEDLQAALGTETDQRVRDTIGRALKDLTPR